METVVHHPDILFRTKALISPAELLAARSLFPPWVLSSAQDYTLSPRTACIQCWLKQGYKVHQFRTTLKGHASSRAPCRIGRGLCYNSQFSFSSWPVMLPLLPYRYGFQEHLCGRHCDAPPKCPFRNGGLITMNSGNALANIKVLFRAAHIQWLINIGTKRLDALTPAWDSTEGSS